MTRGVDSVRWSKNKSKSDSTKLLTSSLSKLRNILNNNRLQNVRRSEKQRQEDHVLRRLRKPPNATSNRRTTRNL